MADGTIAERIETTATALYRHFDASGKLLYVGISLSPTYRLSQHRDASRWFPQIAQVKIEWFPDRIKALEAERDAIQAENPEFNIVHKFSARDEYLIEMAEETAAELTRRIARFDAAYTIYDAAKALSIGEGPLRLALFHGDLLFFYTGAGILISGWSLIAYLEALDAGAVSVRRNPRNDDGTYPKLPNIEAIVSAQTQRRSAAP